MGRFRHGSDGADRGAGRSLTLNLVERVYILEHGRVGLERKSGDLKNNEEVKRVYFQLG